MARLLPSDDARWWRFPVRGPAEINLDHRGKKRALYPVHTFTEEQRRAYRLDHHRGHYYKPFTLKTRPGVLFRGHRTTHDRFEPCWEAWSWRTSSYRTAHLFKQHLVKHDYTHVLAGYGDRQPIEPRTYTYAGRTPDSYDVATIERLRNKKPKALATLWVLDVVKLLTRPGPSTVCGEALKIVEVERIAPDHGIQTVCIARGRPRRVRPSFRYCLLEMLWWGPDKRRFQAWERARRVQWTRKLIPGIVGFQGLHGNTVAKM